MEFANVPLRSSLFNRTFLSPSRDEGRGSLLPQLRLIDNDEDGVDNMALTVGGHVLQRIGEVLVEDGDIVDEVVGAAAIAKPVPTHHLMIFDFNLPTLNLRLIEQVDEVLLVFAVVVE